MELGRRGFLAAAPAALMTGVEVDGRGDDGRPPFGWDQIGPARWRFRSWQWRDGAWRPMIGHAVATPTGIAVDGTTDAADVAALRERLDEIVRQRDAEAAATG